MNEEEWNRCSWRKKADLLAKVLDGTTYDDDSYIKIYFAFIDRERAYEYDELTPQVREKLNGL